MMLYSSTVPAMRFAQSPVWGGLAPPLIVLAALLVGGCGSATKPAGGRGQLDSPITTKTNHLKCLQQAHLPVQVTGPTSLQIGALPGGPTVVFVPTPGSAQAFQISGSTKGAGSEVIGNALLYPHQASDAELKLIETCLGHGVTG
jgi:hypothetical protein